MKNFKTTGFLVILLAINIISFGHNANNNMLFVTTELEDAGKGLENRVEVNSAKFDNETHEIIEEWATETRCIWESDLMYTVINFFEYDKNDLLISKNSWLVKSRWEDDVTMTFYVENEEEDEFVMTFWKDGSMIAYTMADSFTLIRGDISY